MRPLVVAGTLEASGPSRRAPDAGRSATLGSLARAAEGAFGLVALVVGLAVVAPVPVLGLAALGYAVVAEARVAQSGRLRDALFGVRPAARAGTIAAFAWAALVVPRALAARAHDARLVDPDGGGVGFGLAAGAALVAAVAYVACASSQGGRVRDFLRPRPGVFATALVSGAAWARARDDMWSALATRALPLLAAGARALLVGVAWLAVPTTLLLAATRGSGGVSALAGAVGAGLLAIALVVAPYAQGRAALTGRLRDGLDVKAAFAAIARAPLASLLATLATLLLAAPLHLLKIEPVPPGAAWIPSLAFVALGLPSRALTGWALARSRRRTAPAHLVLRVVARAIACAAALTYVGLAVLSQYTSWRGALSLFEQHVLLVPTPFLPW
jgi:hypothetical protein